jgi:hypothetical protein
MEMVTGLTLDRSVMATVGMKQSKVRETLSMLNHVIVGDSFPLLGIPVYVFKI